MTTMIERVARAICAATGDNPDVVRDCELDGPLPAWWLWQDEARAAIAAMREPTEGMVLAGDANGDPTAFYTRMIDAALEEKL